MIKWLICLIYGHNYSRFAGSIKLNFLHFFYSNPKFQPTIIQVCKKCSKVKTIKLENCIYSSCSSTKLLAESYSFDFNTRL